MSEQAAVGSRLPQGGGGGAACILSVFPLRLEVVRNLKKQRISPHSDATHLPQQKQVEQSSSLILKALLGNNVGISLMEKY